jgi:hypothetical protein
MFRSRIAEWAYQLGCLSAVVALIYRVFWFGRLGARLFGEVPHVVPHNFMDLSILMLVISIASNADALVRREDGKTTATGKAA